jgi:isoleucyl-tRNA synthetase
MFVNDAGKFDDTVPIKELVGKNVLSDGNEEVLTMLRNSDNLVFEQEYRHRYPYDWRSKKPVIVRATRFDSH